MGFLFTSKNKKAKNTVAIFDIGSGSVGCAIVELPSNESELPTIIKSSYRDIASSNDNDFDLLFKNMLRALESASSSLNKNNTSVIKEVYCFLASPWYISENRVIKIEREHPFTFTKRFADDLLQKEIFNLSESYKKKYGEEDAPSVVDNLIMGVSLDGVLIDDPIGKNCKNANINILASLSPKFFLNEIRTSISKSFHHIPINFSSFVASSYVAVRDRYISPNSYLLVDVGNEVTDVSIVTDGILNYSVSFPQGKKTFLRSISKYKNIELRDSQELFNLYTTDNLSLPLKTKVEPLFKSIENNWIKSFNKCLSNLPPDLIIPRSVFLTADVDIKKWIYQIITNQKFNVLTLDGPIFLDMCNVKNTTCDPFLMIEAIYITRKI